MEASPEYIPMEAVSREPWAFIYRGRRPGAGGAAEGEGDAVIREGMGHAWYKTLAGVKKRGDDVSPYEGLYLVPSSSRTDVSVFPSDALSCYRVDAGGGKDLYVDFSIHPQSGRRGGLAQAGLAPFRLLIRLFRSAFLPEGYPDSVPPDYLPFQFWDAVQGFCSYVRGMVCTTELMKGIGVGSVEATALGAVFVFLVRDLSGMAAGVVFTSAQGTGFDSHPKQWRLFADFVNNVGLLLDLLAPRALQVGKENRNQVAFLCVLCLARVCFALVGAASGASRSALTYHFSRDGRNAADIAAKEGSQETLASLVGMVAGYALVRCTEGDKVGARWFVFALLTVLHMWANYRAVRSLVLRSLNEDRLEYLWESFCERQGKGTCPGPRDYASEELKISAPSLRLFRGGLQRMLGLGTRVEINFGCPLTRLFGDAEDGAGGEAMAFDFTDPASETYFINLKAVKAGRSVNLIEINVSLLGGLSDQDRVSLTPLPPTPLSLPLSPPLFLPPTHSLSHSCTQPLN